MRITRFIKNSSHWIISNKQAVLLTPHTTVKHKIALPYAAKPITNVSDRSAAVLAATAGRTDVYLVLVVRPYAANRDHLSALSAGFLRELCG